MRYGRYGFELLMHNRSIPPRAIKKSFALLVALFRTIPSPESLRWDGAEVVLIPREPEGRAKENASGSCEGRARRAALTGGRYSSTLQGAEERSTVGRKFEAGASARRSGPERAHLQARSVMIISEF